MKLKKRIVGFLLLVGVVLILIPMIFGRSISLDKLKLQGDASPTLAAKANNDSLSISSSDVEDAPEGESEPSDTAVTVTRVSNSASTVFDLPLPAEGVDPMLLESAGGASTDSTTSTASHTPVASQPAPSAPAPVPVAANVITSTASATRQPTTDSNAIDIIDAVSEALSKPESTTEDLPLSAPAPNTAPAPTPISAPRPVSTASTAVPTMVDTVNQHALESIGTSNRDTQAASEASTPPTQEGLAQNAASNPNALSSEDIDALAAVVNAASTPTETVAPQPALEKAAEKQKLITQSASSSSPVSTTGNRSSKLSTKKPPEKAVKTASPGPSINTQNIDAQGLPSGTSGWEMQLGMFANKKNAERLTKKLQVSGYPVRMAPITTKKGTTLYKVAVGPSVNRADIDQLQTRIQKETGLRGILMKVKAAPQVG